MHRAKKVSISFSVLFVKWKLYLITPIFDYSTICTFRLVNAFRNVTIFSVIYVVGAQLAVYNMVSSFGVPFYHIYVRLSLGFVYDVRMA